MSVLTWDPSEKVWQDEVVKLAKLGGWAYQHQFDSRRSVAGWPDLVLVRPPELVIVELKTLKGRVRPEQQQWLDRLAACGVEVHVWRPTDLDEVFARLVRRRQPPSGLQAGASAP